MGCLYRLDFPSGKSYVGITILTAENRFLTHVKTAKEGKNLLVSKAIRKYGAENVKVVTLVSGVGWDDLKFLEQKAIQELQTLVPNGYNLTSGGEGTNGLADSSRAILADKAKKRWGSLEFRGRLQATYDDPEWQKHTSEIHKALWATPEHREKMLAKRKDPETRKQTSDSVKALQNDADYKAKMAIAYAKRSKNEEYKASILAARTTPEYRAKQAEKMKAIWAARRADKCVS